MEHEAEVFFMVGTSRRFREVLDPPREGGDGGGALEPIAQIQ